ncbi:MAG: phosphoglycerate dehydrogenase [Gammaproteobacteria bacterium]|nr:phosphoglycerate dehydrogenase [Gammaproteobacteria bacterium]
MHKVLTLNNISLAGLDRLPRDQYEVASEMIRPDAILLRSFDMHDFEIPSTVRAVGRAGAGVNNIPVAKLSERGVPVFNAPGANANAVKELVLAGMLISARNICDAWRFAQGQAADSDAELNKQIESGKKAFVGFELPGRTLGVLGLGAIGVEVANAAMGLGMKVIGYDPGLTVSRAWQLSSRVEQAQSVEEVLRRADVLTLHVPLVDGTRELINAERIQSMKPGATLLNFSRAGIVHEADVVDALERHHLRAYVCDFPSLALSGRPGVIALPHIGASTQEAEDNCASMVAEQLKQFLEHGNIEHSVNFPEASMPRNGGYRLSVANQNIPNMVGQISTALAKANLNIIDMLNKSRGDIAYTLIDVDQPVGDDVMRHLGAIQGVLMVRGL